MADAVLTRGGDAEREPAGTRALPIIIVAAAFGLLAQLLFFGVGLGVNFPIAIAALLAAGWAVPPHRSRPRIPDLALPAAALLLASFVAIRGDRTLLVLDVLGSLVLTGAALAAFGGLRVVERPLAGVVVLAARVTRAAAAGALAPLGTARRAIRTRRLRDGLGRAAPIIRGLLIAAPLLVVFAVLFASADAVFARFAGDLLGWDLDLGSIPGRSVVALFVAWVAAGLLAFVATGDASEAEPALDHAWAGRPRLGTTEIVTALIALDMLFAAFVALQAAYLFGGQDTLVASGLTYAEYARRGFFELLAVAFGVGTLVLAFEAFVAHRSRAYLAACIGLVVLTLVVLASAFLRLRLYQEAYGWTEQRFYVLAAIGWFAMGAAAAIACLLADRTRWLIHFLVALSVAFGIAFNAVGPVRYVADRNIARFQHPETIPVGGSRELDVDYLVSLGTDAVPAVVAFFADRPMPPEYWERIANRLAVSAGLDDEGNRSWQAWNLSRERARELLGR